MKICIFEGVPLGPVGDNEYCIAGQSDSSAYLHKPNSSVSGIASLDEAVCRLTKGGYIVDKRHLPFSKKVLCVSGPMDGSHLPPLTYSPSLFNDQTFDSIEGFFSIIKDPGSMSYLSMDLYAEWWRRHGAKIGRKNEDGGVSWKD